MARIHYYDIGDYLSREKKLELLADADGLQGIAWQDITPNEKHDWINQRGNTFDSFVSIGDKRDKDAETIFENYSRGLATGRDTWCYNYSKKNLVHNMTRMIEFYNEQVETYKERKEWDEGITVERFIDNDPKKIAWDRELKKEFEKSQTHRFNKSSITVATYRPFCKTRVYFNRRFNSMVYQMPHIFPAPGVENLVICVTSVGSRKDFCAVISDAISDLELVEKAQCFPLYTYDTSLSAAQSELFQRTRRENISDAMLQKFREHYLAGTPVQSSLTKEDIFYYVYGILHSESYKTRFAADLKKQLPRIPLIDGPPEYRLNIFWTFSRAGRQLAELHLNYETLEPFPLEEKTADSRRQTAEYKVVQMKFPSKTDKSTIIYNSQLHLAGIPAETYRYIVNGRSALEWIMDRYRITTHKDSGIVNDPNDWCTEIGNERYIVDLVKRIVTLSVESVKIIDDLPELTF